MLDAALVLQILPWSIQDGRVHSGLRVVHGGSGWQVEDVHWGWNRVSVGRVLADIVLDGRIVTIYVVSKQSRTLLASFLTTSPS